MQIINLKELYPRYYTEDCYIEVSDEVAEQIAKADRAEHAYIERTRYHKAYYSLDAGDGIEKDVVFVSMSPQEIYERKLSNEELYIAINQLPDKQAKRIYARYFQNMSLRDIVKIESVDVAAVKRSIDSALKKIAKIIKNFENAINKTLLFLLIIGRDFFFHTANLALQCFYTERQLLKTRFAAHFEP